MCQNYQMSVSGKNIRIFNKVAMVILEIKKDQFWCGKAFGRRLMTSDCMYDSKPLIFIPQPQPHQNLTSF